MTQAGKPKPTPDQKVRQRIKGQITGLQDLAEILTGKKPLTGGYKKRFKQKQTFDQFMKEVEKGFAGKAGVPKGGVWDGRKIEIRRVSDVVVRPPTLKKP